MSQLLFGVEIHGNRVVVRVIDCVPDKGDPRYRFSGTRSEIAKQDMRDDTNPPSVSELIVRGMDGLRDRGAKVGEEAVFPC